jgi:hypothetical protein
LLRSIANVLKADVAIPDHATAAGYRRGHPKVFRICRQETCVHHTR